MRRVPTLAARELKTYFHSPLAYLLAALYALLILLFAGLPTLEAGPKAAVPAIVRASVWFLMFLVPILTMRLLAEEKATAAMEVLVTDPVTDWDIVLGKFVAGVLALWAMLLPLGVYLLIFIFVGRSAGSAAEVPFYKLWKWLPQVMAWGPVFTGCIGLALMGALFVAVGLFASSLTRNQAISALVGFVMILMLSALGLLRGLLEHLFPEANLHPLIESLSLFHRIDLMVEGRFDTRAVFLFVSTTALMLYLTVRVVESRKWR